jgi:ElaB/YqjD/DUF883 family membrane-anchored ribosome-binding protein
VDQEGNRGQLDQPLNSAPDEAARIREQIERTRADLSGTIEELQDRLRPEHLVNQAGDAVRGAVEQKVKTMMNTASNTASRVAEQARSSAESLTHQLQTHPLPTALAIGGLAFWLMRRRRASQFDFDDGHASDVMPALAAGALGYYLLSQRTWDAGSFSRRRFADPDYASVPGGLGAEEYGEYEIREEFAGEGASIGDRVRHLGETADQYRQRAQAAVGAYADQAAERARHLRQNARTRVEETTTRLLERSEELGENFDRWMHENPLTVGVAAFAVGAIAGLSLPVTEAEHRTLGVARDSLMEQAGRAVGAALTPANE